MNKKLVAYFSASGQTAKLAQSISNVIEGDLYEITPKSKYTDEDLNWHNKQSRSSLEMKDLSSRPEIIEHHIDMSKYDIIFVGFPIWWYIAPTIINTFLESYDFSNKIIIPFATSGGSGIGETVEKLKTSVSKEAVLKEGTVLKTTTKEDILKWLKGFDIDV